MKFFYKNAKGALLVFDLCDRTSFLNLEFWLKSLRNNINKEIVIFLIGNKCDKLEEREVKEEEIKKFCEEKELQYFLTSAKENIEIKQVFLAMGRKIKKNIQNSIVVETSLLNSISSENYEMKNEKGCAICEC